MQERCTDQDGLRGNRVGPDFPNINHEMLTPQTVSMRHRGKNATRSGTLLPDLPEVRHDWVFQRPDPPFMLRRLQRYFVAGILTLLPIWLMFIVFGFVLSGLSYISAPWIGAILSPLAKRLPESFGWLAGAPTQRWVAIGLTLLLILGIGALSSRVVGQRLLGWFESALARIPLAQTIYGSAKQLLEALKTKPDGTRRVVLIDFPSPEMKTIGLVTRTMRDASTGEELAAVYVPTTPNPTSGYLEIVPVSRLTPTDWTVDQAMAFVISGGAKSPDTIPFHRKDSP